MLNRLLLLLLLASTLPACGSDEDDVSIAVVDHSDALTSGGSDVLFVLTLKSGGPFALTDFEVTAKAPGETETVVNYTHQDADADSELDVDETLSGMEPGVNLFDATHAGKTLEVSLLDATTEPLRELTSANWPAN